MTSVLTKEAVPPLLKVSDVAAYLSVSRHTVHNLIDRGDLLASEINGASKERKHWRITRDSLRKFYRSRFGHSLDLALAHRFEP